MPQTFYTDVEMLARKQHKKQSMLLDKESGFMLQWIMRFTDFNSLPLQVGAVHQPHRAHQRFLGPIPAPKADRDRDQ